MLLPDPVYVTCICPGETEQDQSFLTRTLVAPPIQEVLCYQKDIETFLINIWSGFLLQANPNYVTIPNKGNSSAAEYMQHVKKLLARCGLYLLQKSTRRLVRVTSLSTLQVFFETRDQLAATFDQWNLANEFGRDEKLYFTFYILPLDLSATQEACVFRLASTFAAIHTHEEQHRTFRRVQTYLAQHANASLETLCNATFSTTPFRMIPVLFAGQIISFLPLHVPSTASKNLLQLLYLLLHPEMRDIEFEYKSWDNEEATVFENEKELICLGVQTSDKKLPFSSIPQLLQDNCPFALVFYNVLLLADREEFLYLPTVLSNVLHVHICPATTWALYPYFSKLAYDIWQQNGCKLSQLPPNRLVVLSSDGSLHPWPLPPVPKPKAANTAVERLRQKLEARKVQPRAAVAPTPFSFAKAQELCAQFQEQLLLQAQYCALCQHPGHRALLSQKHMVFECPDCCSRMSRFPDESLCLSCLTRLVPDQTKRSYSHYAVAFESLQKVDECIAWAPPVPPLELSLGPLPKLHLYPTPVLETKRAGKKKKRKSERSKVALEETKEEEKQKSLVEEEEENRLLEEQKRKEEEEEKQTLLLEKQKREKEERKLKLLLEERKQRQVKEQEKLLLEERKRKEEAKLLEETRRQEEEKRLLEERKRQEERQKLLFEEQKRKELERKRKLLFEAEKRRQAKEQERLLLEETKRKEEERRRKEEQERLLLEERKRKEEQERLLLEETKRKEEEERRREEEQERLLLEETKRKEEQERLLLEERKRKEEQERFLLEETKRKQEQERLLLEEEKRLLEERRLEERWNIAPMFQLPFYPPPGTAIVQNVYTLVLLPNNTYSIRPNLVDVQTGTYLPPIFVGPPVSFQGHWFPNPQFL